MKRILKVLCLALIIAPMAIAFSACNDKISVSNDFIVEFQHVGYTENDEFTSIYFRAYANMKFVKYEINDKGKPIKIIEKDTLENWDILRELCETSFVIQVKNVSGHDVFKVICQNDPDLNYTGIEALIEHLNENFTA